jgi:hypothetical protein
MSPYVTVFHFGREEALFPEIPTGENEDCDGAGDGPEDPDLRGN